MREEGGSTIVHSRMLLLSQAVIMTILTNRITTAWVRVYLPGSDDENANVGLGGASNHVGHVVFVPRCVQDGVPLRCCLEMCAADL